jgi:hypothetical protein
MCDVSAHNVEWQQIFAMWVIYINRSGIPFIKILTIRIFSSNDQVDIIG